MNIYADVTDEGLQPLYTYTLDEIVEQYERDGGRMPIGKVYVKYDEGEYYLADPAEVDVDDQLLIEDEVKAAIAKFEAEGERQREREEMERREKDRVVTCLTIMNGTVVAAGILGTVVAAYILLALYFG